ncbi:MAG: hypothetical protein OXC11_02355 [Rhodospirillales bacterium]|nr:hypothetical protein [Rhodospirillales bacterium]
MPKTEGDHVAADAIAADQLFSMSNKKAGLVGMVMKSTMQEITLMVEMTPAEARDTIAALERSIERIEGGNG